MIVDSLKNSGRYASLHPLFQKAFDFVINEAASKEDGKYEIDGDNLFVNIVTAPLKSVMDAGREAHNNYIDIQVVLNGSESFGYVAREKCSKEVAPYNAEKDIIFYKECVDVILPLTEGEFVVFYPEDCHAPLIGNGFVRKAVVKVKL